MEATIKRDNLFDFLKLLIELGGVYRVNDDFFIVQTDDDEPVRIVVGKKAMPIMVYHENMKTGDHLVLNPFVETLGAAPERQWFFTTQSVILGWTLKRMAEKLIEAVNGKVEEDYKTLELISPYLALIDTKTAKELEPIVGNNWLRLNYFKKTKTIEVCSDLLDEEYVKSFGTKIRKKTWELIQGLLEVFLQTDDLSAFGYKATIIGMQEADATFHSTAKIAAAIDGYVKLLLKTDMHVAEFMQHLQYLETYHKLSAWFVAPTIVEPKIPTAPQPPWASTSPAAIQNSNQSNRPVSPFAVATIKNTPTVSPSSPFNTPTFATPNMTQPVPMFNGQQYATQHVQQNQGGYQSPFQQAVIPNTFMGFGSW